MNGLTRRRQTGNGSDVGIKYGDDDDDPRERRRPGGLCQKISSRCHACLQRLPPIAQSMSREYAGEGSWSSIPKQCCGILIQSRIAHSVVEGLEDYVPSSLRNFLSDESDQAATSISARSEEAVPLHNELDLEAPLHQSFSPNLAIDPVQPRSSISEKKYPSESEGIERLPAVEHTPETYQSSKDAVTPEAMSLDAAIDEPTKPQIRNETKAVSLTDYVEHRVDDLPSKPELEVTFSPPSFSEELMEMDASIRIDDDYLFHNDMDENEEKVTFSLRLPNAATLQQQKLDQMQRAERTHDFIETAKSLHLHLDRDKWTAKRSRRGSMKSTSSYTSSIDTSYDASMSASGHERHDSQGSRHLNRPPLSRTNSVTSLHELLQQEAMALRASPTRHLGDSQNLNGHGHDGTSEEFVMPLRDDDKEETNSVSLANSFGKVSSISQESEATEEPIVPRSQRGRRAPRRNSFLAGSKIERYDSISNSSGNGSGQVRYAHHSPRRRSSLSGTQYSGTSSRRSSLSNGQQESQVDTDLQQQRNELGYEDMEVPMKSGSFDTDFTGSRRSSGSGGGSQLDDSYRRSRGRRAPRRSSFVAGSKIETYDAHGHSSSGSARTGRRRYGHRRTSN